MKTSTDRLRTWLVKLLMPNNGIYVGPDVIDLTLRMGPDAFHNDTPLNILISYAENINVHVPIDPWKLNIRLDSPDAELRIRDYDGETYIVKNPERPA